MKHEFFLASKTLMVAGALSIAAPLLCFIILVLSTGSSISETNLIENLFFRAVYMIFKLGLVLIIVGLILIVTGALIRVIGSR